MTVTFDMDDRSKFVFFTYDKREWVRFVDFWGCEEVVSLNRFCKILRDEKKRRQQPSIQGEERET